MMSSKAFIFFLVVAMRLCPPPSAKAQLWDNGPREAFIQWLLLRGALDRTPPVNSNLAIDTRSDLTWV
ncbi:hypothetical protein ACFX2C_044164 [Malus domestica]